MVNGAWFMAQGIPTGAPGPPGVRGWGGDGGDGGGSRKLTKNIRITHF